MKRPITPGDIVYYFGTLYRVIGYGLEGIYQGMLYLRRCGWESTYRDWGWERYNNPFTVGPCRNPSATPPWFPFRNNAIPIANAQKPVNRVSTNGASFSTALKQISYRDDLKYPLSPINRPKTGLSIRTTLEYACSFIT